MAEELAIEYLTISPHDEPPADATLSQAVATAGLGAATFAAPQDDSQRASGGRTRLGTYTLTPPVAGARARLVIARYDAPVMADMGEAAFVALTRGVGTDDTRTLRDGRLSLELRLRIAPEQAPAMLDWALRVVQVVQTLTQGATLDLAAQRCLGRADLARMAPGMPMVHIALHNAQWDAESRWLNTHGLQKFGRPELELVGVPHSLEAEATDLLTTIAENLAAGASLKAGQEIDLEAHGQAIALGTSPDPDHQAPYGRLRLADIPLPGERQGMTARRLLLRMALATAEACVLQRDEAGAEEAIERALAADPDECAALTFQARLHLRAGRPVEALELGEFMELRVPDDYRGPLVVALALAAMDRYREALNALNRALEREPEAAEVFAVRSEVHARLGHEQLAAVDRAHAAYLAR